MILNDDIDIEKGRAYTAAARTAAQMLTAEVQSARYLQKAPDLSFDVDEDEA